MHQKLFIRKLSLRGPTKNYEYQFNRGLNLIVGPIFTGKTSLLQFIDYCLGAKAHPKHKEVRNKVVSVLLELEINENIFTIDRLLFSSEKSIIHECSIDALSEKHLLIKVFNTQKKGEESISSYLLKKLGLFGIYLKESPSKNSSDIDMMSFRDLMSFSYLPHERLDNKNLLFENEPLKNLKLKQVFNIIFDVYNNKAAHLSFQIKQLEDELKEKKKKISTLTEFFVSSNIPPKKEMSIRIKNLQDSEIQLKSDLNEITKTLKSGSDTLQELRQELTNIRDEITYLRVKKRDRDTLLKRLLPLRGQYSEEIKKFQFLQESKKILDPLGIVRCPYCLEEIIDSEVINNCCLCGKELTKEKNLKFNLDKEIRSTEVKLSELNKYIQELNLEIEQIDIELKRKNNSSKLIGLKLDEEMKNFISPYISQRDFTIESLTKIREEILNLNSQISFYNLVEEEIKAKNELEASITQNKVALESENAKEMERQDIIKYISNRFGDILESAHFPKLENPLIDENLVPFVRDQAYREVGSGGALTLISISWFLSIFEGSLELDEWHPGFAMIDSLQKNIGISASEKDQDFRDTRIVEGLYSHIIEKTLVYRDDFQLIIIDNEPPKIADEYITVKFSRNPKIPPYGLIDDEIE